MSLLIARSRWENRALEARTGKVQPQYFGIRPVHKLHVNGVPPDASAAGKGPAAAQVKIEEETLGS
jgi:hypothetical protein